MDIHLYWLEEAAARVYLRRTLGSSRTTTRILMVVLEVVPEALRIFSASAMLAIYVSHSPV